MWFTEPDELLPPADVRMFGLEAAWRYLGMEVLCMMAYGGGHGL